MQSFRVCRASESEEVMDRLVDGAVGGLTCSRSWNEVDRADDCLLETFVPMTFFSVISHSQLLSCGYVLIYQRNWQLEL